MPREFVVGEHLLVGDGGDPGVPGVPQEHWQEGLVQVSWAEGDVQVATMSRMVVSKETVNEGLYIDLDRRGINDLIRLLRRARDRAYGRDE